MSDFIKKTIAQIDENDCSHLQTLSNNDGIATNWALYHSKTNPGFFTSFNQKVSVTDDLGEEVEVQETPFGMQQAAIAIGLLPALQLQTALVAAISVPGMLLFAVSATFAGDWKAASGVGMGALAFTTQAVYFSGAFVLNLLKEVTAFITRSIATLVDMCHGAAGNVNANSPIKNVLPDAEHGTDTPVPAEIRGSYNLRA